MSGTERSALAELEKLGVLQDDQLSHLTPCLRSTVQAAHLNANYLRRRMHYAAAASWVQVARAAGALLQRADEVGG